MKVDEKTGILVSLARLPTTLIYRSPPVCPAKQNFVKKVASLSFFDSAARDLAKENSFTSAAEGLPYCARDRIPLRVRYRIVCSSFPS